MRAVSRRLGPSLVAAAILCSGLMLQAQLPHAVGEWAPAGAAADGRSNAAAVALPDGRTLIFGGRSADGTITDAILVRDVDGAIALAGTMLAPRAGHAAALLADGRVLVAGGTTGDTVSADLEIFDPAAGTSSIAGTLAVARSGAAAARLANGSVLIVGGTADGTALVSTEIFDPKAGSIVVSANLLTPRSGASATTLIDGRVLVAGGNDGTTDLRTAEIFEPSIESFSVVDRQMSAARSGHSALLLPNNNSVLIAGGSADGNAQTTADLFLPVEFPDPYSYGMGQFAAAAPMARARSGAISGPLTEGFAFVSGGGAAVDESYRFPTIKTDKDDYAPGQLALINGTGWQPDEVVRLRFQEDPAVHDDYVLEVTADADGNIQWDRWAPEEHDLGVRFYLIARGISSGRVAQTTFTDGQPRIINATPTPFSPFQASSAGAMDTTLITAKNQGGGNLTGFEIRIRRTDGTVVRTFLIGTVASNAEPTRTWDGKDDGAAFVADGSYIVRAFASGSGESTAANDSKTVVVDNTNPTVTLSAPADGAVVTGTVQLRALPLDSGGNDDNIALVEFYVDGDLVGWDDNSSSGWRTDFTPTGSHTWYAKAYDKAGNNAISASRTFVFDNDTTAPVITPNISGTLGTNGWYTSNVDITWTVTDPESTVSSTTGCDPISVTSDTAGTTFTCSATSGGGTASASVTIKRDASAPNAPAGNRTPAANGNGWNNTDVTVSFTADGDNGPSGVASCSASTSLSVETSGAPVSGHCTDNAGNIGPDTTVIVKIDKTKPVVAGSRSPAANGFGWNNTDVTVSFTCADSAGAAPSGIASNTVAGATLTGEGANQSVTNTGACVDVAGNAADSATVSDINIDKTAPTIVAALDRAAAATGWFNIATGRPSVTFSCADPLSGLEAGACPASVGPFADGADQQASGSVTDRAGNSASASVTNIDVDLTAPAAAIVAPAHGSNYVLNASVASSYSCSDATSGVAACAGPVPSGSAFQTGSVGAKTFTVNVMDVAGNPGTASVEYSVLYATGACLGSMGHQILEPVNPDGSSIFKQKSTVPSKFRVCDANGVSIGTPGVVQSFALTGVSLNSSSLPINEEILSTTPDATFRWSASDQQWIFNLSTKNLTAGRAYTYTIVLNDGSTIGYTFTLK